MARLYDRCIKLLCVDRDAISNVCCDFEMLRRYLTGNTLRLRLRAFPINAM
jgi:hypothetical protein